ncbi:hypothetical protein Cgig2_001027 [Carnegiea gigantea]|uniref:Uncharacterized protein n=1 Tax=Carnegiea gigantea TaxID=171969 RepID=A0A9Q1GTA5_9CARY|nr:hypothetical protein Cgig2_001027 [Carnegiea gigantea]
MAENVTRHFVWDQHGVAFLPSHLPKDFQPLCPSFELAVAREAAEYYELPELPKNLGSCKDERSGLWSQPSLSSIGAPLNRESGYTVTEFSKLDSVHRSDRVRVRELVGKKRVRRWSQRMRARPLEGRPHLRVAHRDFPISSFPYPPSINTTSFSHIGYSSIHFSRGSGIKYREINRHTCFPCQYGVPSYLQHEGDGQLHEGVLHLALEGRFASASPLSRRFSRLMPRFLLSKAEGAAADFELPEIVQVTFYAMLLNEVVELGVAYDFTAKSLKSSLVGLRWSTFEVWMGCVDHVLRAAQLQRPADEVEIRGPLDGQEEGSGSNSLPAPSGDEE